MSFIPRPSFGGAQRGYDPNQPRVPAGNPDGGQWTDAGGSGDLDELSAARRRRPGPERGPPKVGWPMVMWAIFKALRARELLNDLFGNELGVVARLELNGQEVWGVNSESSGYTSADDAAARRMRSSLMKSYQGLMNVDNIGQHPNDALFHAETTALLRAAKKNGGTLAGLTLEVFVEKAPCPSCGKLLPYVGLELGNPTVTFVPRIGERVTMRNGKWD
jgi:hypothetical protein